MPARPQLEWSFQVSVGWATCGCENPPLEKRWALGVSQAHIGDDVITVGLLPRGDSGEKLRGSSGCAVRGRSYAAPSLEFGVQSPSIG